jgi:hypothetical protein
MDQQNAVIPDAVLEIKNVDTGLTYTTKTNKDGIYSFPNLPPGRYLMNVSKNQFRTISVTGITLHVQDDFSRNFVMQVGSSAESVTVTGDQININTTDGSVSTVVDHNFVENMPLNGRSFQSLITLTPGVVPVPGAGTGAKGEFSVNGQRTEANYYTVDGVSATNGSATVIEFGTNGFAGSVPSQTALGTTHSLVSLDALQEFRIQTSTYSAEYGRTPGGQISFATRSGTNDWHGTAFDYLRNSVFDANNWFNNAAGLPKTSERQNDFGGTLGGPVVIPHIYNGKDRTFFFFSYEGLRVSTPQPAVTTQVPDLTSRQSAPAPLRPYLDAFPIPNGPSNGDGSATFTAAFSTPGSIDAISVRIDQTINNKISLFGRYNDSPSQTSGPTTVYGPAGCFCNFFINKIAIRSLTLGTTALLTAHLTDEFRLNYTLNKEDSPWTLDDFGGAVPFALKDVTYANGQPNTLIDSLSFGAFLPDANWGYNFFDLHNQQQHVNIVDTLSYISGSHTLKFGMDYRRLSSPFGQFKEDEEATISSISQLQQNLIPAYLFSDNQVPVGPVYTNLSLFAQDEWKVTPRINLSVGVRWELDPPPGDIYGNGPYGVDEVTNLADTAITPKGTPLWKTTLANFAPRFGVAYQLNQTTGKETVIRGGFGLFYDIGNTFASSGYGGVGDSVFQFVGNVPFPLSADQLALPAPSTATPYNGPVFGFDPHLKLPYTLQWNLAVEQTLGRNQTLTVGYVGSHGQRLLWDRELFPSQLGNSNFAPGGVLALTTNSATSDYDALQIQLTRRLSKGLQLLVSYTWSHSVDDSSNNFFAQELLRASSDFDIRHNFQTAVTYDVPSKYENRLAALLHNWSLDGRVTAYSALPFDVTAGTIIFDSVSGLPNLRADLVPGQPLYINDPTAPGGRRVNFNAFTIPTQAEQAAGQYGDAPRNILRGFSTFQLDMALRREFPLRERLKLQFRAEAFNLFNHPNFGAFQNNLTFGPDLFGRAIGTLNNQLGGLNPLYQVGGPRSLQLALKLFF